MALDILATLLPSSYPDVMSVKDRGAAQDKLRAATDHLEAARALVTEITDADPPSLTFHELTDRFGVSEEVVVVLLETLSELVGEAGITVKDARRAGMLAAAGQAWENELGPSLSSAQVRELLGDVSRQRVDELLREHRLIGLRDSSGRRRFPVFAVPGRWPTDRGAGLGLLDARRRGDQRLDRRFLVRGRRRRARRPLAARMGARASRS